MSGILDLDKAPDGHELDIKISAVESKGEKLVRLTKEIILFVVAVGFSCLVVYICYSTVISTTATPEEKKWAMSIISGVCGGVIGYLMKK